MKAKSQPKIFVLDTSVILYDHQAPTEFDDNHIAIPIQVLEELDNFKKEMIQEILLLGNLFD